MRLALALLAALLVAGCLDGLAPPPGSSDNVTTTRPPPQRGPCDPAGPDAVYNSSELADIAWIEKSGSRERVGCILVVVTPLVRTWNGSRYDLVNVTANMDGSSQTQESWSVTVTGSFADLPRIDRARFTVVVRNEIATLEDSSFQRQAFPTERAAQARAIFQNSTEWPDVRDHAPHEHRNASAWAPGGQVTLSFDAIPPEHGGIPERPFATVIVDVDRAEVLKVTKSLWWNGATS